MKLQGSPSCHVSPCCQGCSVSLHPPDFVTSALTPYCWLISSVTVLSPSLSIVASVQGRRGMAMYALYVCSRTAVGAAGPRAMHAEHGLSSLCRQAMSTVL